MQAVASASRRSRAIVIGSGRSPFPTTRPGSRPRPTTRQSRSGMQAVASASRHLVLARHFLTYRLIPLAHFFTLKLVLFDISALSSINIIPTITEPQNPRYQGGALGLDRAWITYNSENLVWLPSEYRPSCSAISGETVGIGVGSGKVWICNIELDES